MGYKKRELGAGLANSKAEGKETLEVAGYGGGREQRGRDPEYYLGKLCQSYLRLKAETRMRGRDMK